MKKNNNNDKFMLKRKTRISLTCDHFPCNLNCILFNKKLIDNLKKNS